MLFSFLNDSDTDCTRASRVYYPGATLAKHVAIRKQKKKKKKKNRGKGFGFHTDGTHMHADLDKGLQIRKMGKKG